MVFLEYNIIVLGAAMPWKSHLPDLQTQVLDVHHFHVVVASPSQHNLPRPSFPRAPSTHPPPSSSSPRPHLSEAPPRKRKGRQSSFGRGRNAGAWGRQAGPVNPSGRGSGEAVPPSLRLPGEKKKGKKRGKRKKRRKKGGKGGEKEPPPTAGGSSEPCPAAPRAQPRGLAAEPGAGAVREAGQSGQERPRRSREGTRGARPEAAPPPPPQRPGLRRLRPPSGRNPRAGGRRLR